MEEIKVNEYVRTKQGIIGKVLEIDDIFAYLDREVKYIEETESSIEYIHRISITKHSENILELIEIGDILEIEEDGIRGYIGWDKDTTTLSYKDMIEDIKKGDVKLLGIITRQQFNSIKYEVE